MNIAVGSGPYWEGFIAARGKRSHLSKNPYTDVRDHVSQRQWSNGFKYGSRECALCQRHAANDSVRCFAGEYLKDFERYGITKEQSICFICYRLKSSAAEHTIYVDHDDWKTRLRMQIQFVDTQNMEAPFREIHYYGLPWRKYENKFHSFTIVTNGDRLDIRNPHIKESIEDMISFSKEQILSICHDLHP